MSHMVGISALAEWERVEAALPPLATADNDGLMTKEDKGELQKLLDRLEALGGTRSGLGSGLGIFDCTHLVTFDPMTYIEAQDEDERYSEVNFKNIDFLENYSYLLYIAFDREHNFKFGARYDIDIDALHELGERQYIEYQTDIQDTSDDDESTIFYLQVELCAPKYTRYDYDSFESYHSYAHAAAEESYTSIYQIAFKEL